MPASSRKLRTDRFLPAASYSRCSSCNGQRDFFETTNHPLPGWTLDGNYVRISCKRAGWHQTGSHGRIFMERRKFLASSLAASALAASAPGSFAEAAQGATQSKGREFYQLRRYHLNAGPQRK